MYKKLIIVDTFRNWLGCSF